MNKTNFATNGGFPVLLDDITFEQAAVREAFYGLLSAFGITPADSFIISGCAFDAWPSPTSYGAGYVSINGEILKVDAAPIPAGTDTLYWDVVSSFSSPGDKVLESGSTFQAYEVRKAKLYNAVIVPGTKLLADNTTATLGSKIVEIAALDDTNTDLATYILSVVAAANIYAIASAMPALILSEVAASGLYAAKAIAAWHEVGAVSEPAFQNSWVNDSSTRKARFRKDNFGMVKLSGVVKGSNGSPIFTLPVGYRPAANHNVSFSVPRIDGTTNTGFSVDSNGNVFSIVNYGGLASWCLDGIEFYVD